MRYSIEPKEWKKWTKHKLLSFSKHFGNKYGQKLFDQDTKSETEAFKTASKFSIKNTRSNWVGRNIFI